MSIKETYEKKLLAQLDEWNADIDKLKAKVDKADSEAQLEYYKLIEDLRLKQEAAREDIKTGIDSA